MDESLVVNAEVTRRRRTIAEKRKIVEQTLQSGVSVARVAREHGVNANQVFYWRQQYRNGRLGQVKANGSLLPVTVVAQEAQAPSDGMGTIEVKIAKGHIRIAGRADVRALEVMLEYLLR